MVFQESGGQLLDRDQAVTVAVGLLRRVAHLAPLVLLQDPVLVGVVTLQETRSVAVDSFSQLLALRGLAGCSAAGGRKSPHPDAHAAETEKVME